MSILQDERVLEVGFTKMRMYLTRLSCTLKNDEDSTFYVRFITTKNELERNVDGACSDNRIVSIALLWESSKTEQAAFFTQDYCCCLLGTSLNRDIQREVLPTLMGCCYLCICHYYSKLCEKELARVFSPCPCDSAVFSPKRWMFFVTRWLI